MPHERQKIRPPSRLALPLAVVYFLTNVASAYAVEANFWSERRRATEKLKNRPSLAEALPAMEAGAAKSGRLSSEQHQLLAQLPRAAQLDFGVAENRPLATAVSERSRPVRAQASAAFKAGSPGSEDWLSQLILPFGSLREVHLSPAPGAPFIIHIQDAHGIEEAQKNMAAMIQRLRAARGLNLVGLEGAAGGFDLAPYRDFPDPAVTKDIADYFLKEGYLGGPEHAALTAESPPLLWGAEDLSLYESNIQAFRDSLKNKPAVHEALTGLDRRAAALKEKIYSPSLKEFDRRYAAYKSRREGLAPYVRYLMSRPVSAGGYPNLRLLVNALDWEDSLDFKAVEKERLRLVETLAENLSQDQLADLVRQSLQYRLGQMTYGGYHRYLRGLCRAGGVALENFGPLNSYINYVLLAERINRNDLLMELAELERSAQDALALRPDQKRLVAAARSLLLLEKLTGHNMTPPDWLYYEQNRNTILRVAEEIRFLEGQGARSDGLAGKNPTSAPAVIARSAATKQSPSSLAPRSPPRISASGAPGAGSSANGLTPELLAPFEEFCLYAVRRNNALVDNLLAKMKADKTSSAVLVAGGFHTDGLTQVLRRQNASYVVVTPKITEVPKDHNYLDVFARDPLPLEQLFSGDKIYMVRPPATAPSTPAVSGGTFAEGARQRRALWTGLQTVLQGLRPAFEFITGYMVERLPDAETSRNARLADLRNDGRSPKVRIVGSQSVVFYETKTTWMAGLWRLLREKILAENAGATGASKVLEAGTQWAGSAQAATGRFLSGISHGIRSRRALRVAAALLLTAAVVVAVPAAEEQVFRAWALGSSPDLLRAAGIGLGAFSALHVLISWARLRVKANRAAQPPPRLFSLPAVKEFGLYLIPAALFTGAYLAAAAVPILPLSPLVTAALAHGFYNAVYLGLQAAGRLPSWMRLASLPGLAPDSLGKNWVRRNTPALAGKNILEVTMEMALSEDVLKELERLAAEGGLTDANVRAAAMATTVGGIGPLLKERIIAQSRLGAGVTGVSLLYDNVWVQRVQQDGSLKLEKVPVGNILRRVLDPAGEVSVEMYDGSTVQVKVWKAPEASFGEADVYFLDAPEISDVVYPGKADAPPGANAEAWEKEARFKQSWLAGRGALALMKRENKVPDVAVISEAPAMYVHHRMFQDRFSTDTFFDGTRYVFNDHTPLDYAHPKWTLEEAQRLRVDPRYYENMPVRDGKTGLIDTTAVIINAAEGVFGVAEKHGRVMRAMPLLRQFAAKIRHVTNGVSALYWPHARFLDGGPAGKTDEELVQAKDSIKQEEVSWLAERLARENETDRAFWMNWKASVLAEGNSISLWTRRIVWYKRAERVPDILENKRQTDRLKSLADQLDDVDLKEEFLKTGIVQIIGGRIHQDDSYGMEQYRRIQDAIRQDSRLKGRVIFFTDYNILEARRLMRMADIAVMLADDPREASATGFQKAQMNGALIIASNDGAVPESVVFDDGTNEDEANGVEVPYGEVEVGGGEVLRTPTAQGLLAAYVRSAEILRDPARRAKIIRNALNQTTQVGVERTSQDMLRLLEDVVKDPRRDDVAEIEARIADPFSMLKRYVGGDVREERYLLNPRVREALAEHLSTHPDLARPVTGQGDNPRVRFFRVKLGGEWLLVAVDTGQAGPTPGRDGPKIFQNVVDEEAMRVLLGPKARSGHYEAWDAGPQSVPYPTSEGRDSYRGAELLGQGLIWRPGGLTVGVGYPHVQALRFKRVEEPAPAESRAPPAPAGGVFPGLTVAVSLRDAGAVRLADGTVGHRRALTRLKDLLPRLSSLGVRRIYAYGPYATDPISKEVHRQMDRGDHLIVSPAGRVAVLVGDYKGKTQEVNGTLLADAPNLFAPLSPDVISPDLAENAARAEQEFVNAVRAAHDQRIDFITDLIPRLGPSAVTADNYRWTIYRELNDEERVLFTAGDGETPGQAEKRALEQLLKANRRYAAIKITENGQSRWILVLHESNGPHVIHKDQVALNPFLPEVRQFFIDALKKHVDRGVDGVRVDLAHTWLREHFLAWLGGVELPSHQRDIYEGVEPWKEIFAEVKKYAQSKDRTFSFLVEAYGDEERLFLELGADEVYFKGLFDAYARRDWREMKRLAAELMSGRLQARLAFPSNYDEQSLRNLGGPAMAFLTVHLLLALKGAPVMMDLRELLAHSGHMITVPGGVNQDTGAITHPWVNAGELANRDTFDKLLAELGDSPVKDLMDTLRGLAPAAGEPGPTVETLDTGDSAVLAFAVTAADGRRFVVAANLSEQDAGVWVRPPEGWIPGVEDKKDYLFSDLFYRFRTSARAKWLYERRGKDLRSQGLNVTLEPGGSHIFYMTEREAADHPYGNVVQYDGPARAASSPGNRAYIWHLPQSQGMGIEGMAFTGTAAESVPLQIGVRLAGRADVLFIDSRHLDEPRRTDYPWGWVEEGEIGSLRLKITVAFAGTGLFDLSGQDANRDLLVVTVEVKNLGGEDHNFQLVAQGASAEGGRARVEDGRVILSGKASVIVQPEFNPTQVAVSGPGYTLEGPSTVLLSDETAAFSFQVAGALTEDEPAAVRRLERLPDGSASDLIAEGQRRWAKLLGTLESPEVKDHQNVLYRAVIILMKNIVSRADSNGLGVPVPNRSSDLEVQLPAAALSIAALAELDADAAEGAVRALLSEDPEDAVRLQSPALAWAARQVYERKMTPRDGKPSSAVQRKAEKFLREIYPSLTAWNGAWRTVYDEDGDGLVSRDGVVEADLNAHLLMDMKTLAWMARALGKEAEAAQWEQRAETLGRMMLYNLYDVQSHTFRNMDADSREFVGAQERPSLLPLLAGVPLPAEAVWATTEEQFLGESSLDVLDPARAYFSLILLSSVSGLMAHKGWHDRAERLNQKINESRGSLLAYYDLNGLQGRSGTEIVQDFSPAAAAALLAGLKRQADQGVWTPEEHRELSPIPPAPEPAYAGVYVNNDRVHLRLIRDSVIKSAEVFLPPEGEGDIASLVLQMLREMLEEMESQTGVPGYLASAGIAANPLGRNRQPRRDMAAGIGSRLWLEWDVPWWRSRVRGFSHAAVTTRAAAESLQWHRAGPLDVVDVVPDDDTGEMRPSELASFEEYRRLTIERGYATPEIWNDIEREARAFKGKKAVFLNSTAQGGGVALMRHAIIRLYRQLGVDAHWFVLEGNPQVFEITKNKMHNVFQAIPGYGGELTDMDREILADFARHNFERMKWVLADADVIVKDDYQGVEMLPMIRAVNPQAKILYRSHIQIQARLIDAAEETPQKTLWAYVLDKLQKAEIDLFISHPLPEFVPGLREDADGAYMELPSSFGASRVPVDFMGATTDPLDGLNKPLTDEQRQFHMERFNEVLQRAGQEPLDLARPWFIQVARFDPAKGIPELIEAYSRFRRRLEEAKAAGTISAETPVPQLVIMGHGAVDDPEGQPLYDKAREQIRSLPLEIARDIKVARVAHNDQVLNAALRGATAALQLSIAEGFEVKVSEAKDKGVPVIAYETGGIPKQIHDGESGHLVPVGEVNSSSDRTRRMDQVAGLLYQYATDDGFRERMQAGAARDRRPDAWTPMNALRWLRHFNRAPRRMSAEVAGEQLTLFNMAPGLSLLALTPAGAAPGIAAAAAFGLGLLTFALLFKWGMLVSRRRAAAHVGVRQSPGVRRQEDRAGIVRALGEEILKDVVLDGRARPVQWSLPNGQTVGVEGLLAEDRLGGERLHRRLGELLNGTDPDEAKGLVAAGLQKALVQHSGVDVSGIGAEMGENPISLVAAPRDLRALLPRLLGVQTSGRLLVLVESLREAEQEARILGLKRHNGDWLSENGVIVRFEAAGPALKGDRFRLAEADPRLRIFAGSTPYTSVNVFVADHLTVDDSGLAGDSPLRRAVIIFINSLLQALPLRFEDLPHLDKAARYLAQQA